MEKVQDLVNEIKSTISQKTSSNKDEVKIMRAMMNDNSYRVGVYAKDGLVGEYCPAESARELASAILHGAAGLTEKESTVLANNYTFGKTEAKAVVDMSKEFLHTYIHTGRKISLGGRAESDISIGIKEIEPSERPFPKVVGIGDDGKKIYGRGVTKVGKYESIKVYSPCPAWIKENT